MIKEIPQPITEEAVSPAPMTIENHEDLSHDLLNPRSKVKKLGGVIGLTAAISLAGTGAVRGQENPKPTLTPETTPIVSFMEIADKNEDGKLNVGEVVIAIPEYLQALTQRAQEITETQLNQIEEESPEPTLVPEPKDLKKLIDAKKHPKGNLKEIREELFSYLQENPEIDEKVRNIEPEFNPELIFDYCLSKDINEKLNGCANTLIFLLRLNKISDSDEVYEITDKFMGATKKDIGLFFQNIYEFDKKNQKKHPELYE